MRQSSKSYMLKNRTKKQQNKRSPISFKKGSHVICVYSSDGREVSDNIALTTGKRYKVFRDRHSSDAFVCVIDDNGEAKNYRAYFFVKEARKDPAL